MKNSKTKAFTLAEVLITLAIIGVVASMTIPTLMQNTQDKELRVAWKKHFSMFSQALMEITAQNGGQFDASSQDTFINSFLSVLKYTKTGYASTLPYNLAYKCYKSDVECYNFSTYYNRYYVLLDDGAIAYFYLYDSGYSAYRSTGQTGVFLGDIIIDVNGVKKPNMYGKDTFSVYVEKIGDSYKIAPAGTSGDFFTCSPNSNSTLTTEGCSAIALTDQQMP